MRAKFINEIKQNINTSGLGSIGVGKTAVLRGYNYLNNHFIWAHFSKLMSKTFKNDKYKKMLDSIESEFGIDINVFLWIPISEWDTSKKFAPWLKSLDWDKKMSMQINPGQSYSEDKIVAKYNSKFNVGYLLIINGMHDKPDTQGYFVQYLAEDYEINEIKQNTKGTGLGAIGIGKGYLFPGLSMTRNKYPEIFSGFSDYSSFMKVDDLAIRVHGNEIEKLFRLINKDVNDAIWADREELEDKFGDVQEFKNTWYNDASLEHLNDDNYRMYYNEILKMGTFLWIDDADDIISEYFFIIDK